MLPFELPFGLTVLDVILLGLTTTACIMLVRLSRNLKKHRSLEHSPPSVLTIAKALREQAEEPERLRESGEPTRKLGKVNSAKASEKKEPSSRSPEGITPSIVAREPEHTTHSISSSSAKPLHSPENVKTLRETEKKIAKPKTSERKEPSSRSPKGSAECPHYFGYLRTLLPGADVPEVCYSCARIMRCIYSQRVEAKQK